MRKLLIGPALLGATALGGSFYGRESTQIVHKSPGAVYAALNQAIDNAPASGTWQFEEGGRSVPYSRTVEHVSDQHLLIKVAMNDRPGAEADVSLAPAEEGKSTLVTVKVHTDHAILREALAGTSQARLAYAPDWLLTIAAGPAMKDIAARIEDGTLSSDTQQYFSRADWESRLPPEQRHQLEEWRQYQASKPALDPDAAARNYMNGNGSSN